MFFKPEFKEKILDGSMCAFISEYPKPYEFPYELPRDISVGDKFFFVTRGQSIDTQAPYPDGCFSRYLAKAKCLGVIYGEFLFNCGGEGITCCTPCEEKVLSRTCISPESLGFSSSREAKEFYTKSLGPDLKGYLHIFKLIDNKGVE